MMYSKNNAPAGTVPFYRLSIAYNADHFYTTNVAEKDYAIAHGATLEGPDGIGNIYPPDYTPTTGLTPLYRFVNLKTGTHYYTLNYPLASNRWKYEGVAGYLPQKL